MTALIEGCHHRMDSKLFSTPEPQVEMHLLDHTTAEGKQPELDVQFYISATRGEPLRTAENDSNGIIPTTFR